MMSAKYEVLKVIQGRDILAGTNYKFCRPVRTFLIVFHSIEFTLGLRQLLSLPLY